MSTQSLDENTNALVDTSTLGTDVVIRNFVIDALPYGIICVDRKLNVTIWNRSVETMTGLNRGAMVGHGIAPSTFRMKSSESGETISETTCPFLECLSMGESHKIVYQIAGRSGRQVKVEFNMTPITNQAGDVIGAMAVLHDTSAQVAMHQQLNDLYLMAVLDPLTQVANRAEFERLMREYVASHREVDLKCSLIICDIDFFKSINDNYGHHVGDQALISFARFLKNFVRSHDLVARYGGEEFIILCANCDEDAAVQRAEKIRFKLEKTAQPMLEGKCLTASFGVSELKDSDDTTSFFVRADHALLRAKEMGRNRVMRADTSRSAENEIGSGATSSVSGVSWRKLKSEPLLSLEFQTQTPKNVLAEKIRCIIPELNGHVKSGNSTNVEFVCEVSKALNLKDETSFQVGIEMHRADSAEEANEVESNRSKAMTFLRITISPKKSKKRWFSRKSGSKESATRLMAMIRQYLTLNEESSLLKVNAAVTKSTRQAPPA